jgi:nitric oxide reductase large subunit
MAFLCARLGRVILRLGLDRDADLSESAADPGLFIGPLVSEQEPKHQHWGGHLLFFALLPVVVGSLTGEWLSIHNKLRDQVSFYLGHQGYEYVDLGRAWGSVFSALEVIPLTLGGFDAMDDLRRSRSSPWVQRYKWPIYFFIAVAFWNMVSAGRFGFMIDPPMALYYMQGLNTTPLHGHAALFGVYGMLGIGLMLLCLRVLVPGMAWKECLLRFSFWTLNGGPLAMCLLSLLSVGLMQTWASVEHGYWYARSSEFMQTPVMQTLRWMRIPGDTLFFLGAVTLVCFIIGLKTGRSFQKTSAPDTST